MRLLEIDRDGGIAFCTASKIPPYAVLSHTWGQAHEEVTYQDILAGNGRGKAGQKKIDFCALQARRDGLAHIWIDTCCIDRTSAAELSEAITSMFRFYANSEKCYVYLQDVRPSTRGEQKFEWSMQDLANARWFTRGWTLQELLAPRTVEFFSGNGSRIGTRISLEQHIVNITQIPAEALRGRPLSRFSVEERFGWQKGRMTTKEEDLVYSLLGVFGIFFPVIYGEGYKSARKRLEKKMKKAVSSESKDDDFLIAYRVTDTLYIDTSVPRAKKLQAMHAALSDRRATNAVVLHGAEGTGKTQLAVRYATLHRTSYSAVLWFNARDEISLRLSFAEVARQIYRDYPFAEGLGSLDTGGQLEDLIDAVQGWCSLPNNEHWLAIYDDYDNPQTSDRAAAGALQHHQERTFDIHKYLLGGCSEISHGSIIVTTRWAKIDSNAHIHGSIGEMIEIGPCSEWHNRLAILSSTSKRETIAQVKDSSAQLLANEFNGIPLALAAGGAFLHQSGMDFDEYRSSYTASRAKFDGTGFSTVSDDDKRLFALWETSYYDIQEKHPLSAKLLELWAYFDPQDVWFELLFHSGAPEWIYELKCGRLEFHEAARVLCDYGMARRDSCVEEVVGSVGYSIHHSVHSWTRTSLNALWDVERARFAVRCVVSYIPNPSSTKAWLSERRVLRHASYCVKEVEVNFKIADTVAWEYRQIGNLNHKYGSLPKAESAYRLAFEGYQKAVQAKGPSWPPTSARDSRDSSSAHSNSLLPPSASGDRHPSVLHGQIKDLPSGSSTESDVLHVGGASVADVDLLGMTEMAHALGNVCKDQRNFKEAARVYELAFEALDEEYDPQAWKLANEQGDVYKIAGEYDKALEAYFRAAPGLTRDDQSLNQCPRFWSKVGNIHLEQGKLLMAESLLKQAFLQSEALFGAKDQLTLEIRHSLKAAYSQRRGEPAGPWGHINDLYQRVMDPRRYVH